MKGRLFNDVRRVLITSWGKSSAQNAHTMHAQTKPQPHTHKENLLTFMSISKTNNPRRFSIGNYLD